MTVLAEKASICSGGSPLSNEFSKYTLYLVAKALDTMHKNGLVHGDLKARNVLCDQASGKIRVITAPCAFSKYHLRDYEVMSTQGCPFWITPELVNENTLEVPTVKGDVWAFGCLAYQLATGKAPFV